MNKNELGDESVFIEPDLEAGDGKIIFNGEEIPIRGKKPYTKKVKRYINNKKEDHKLEGSREDINQRSKMQGMQYTNSKEGEEPDKEKINTRTQNKNLEKIEVNKMSMTSEELKKAVVWAEILGKPVCKTRSARRRGRR